MGEDTGSGNERRATNREEAAAPDTSLDVDDRTVIEEAESTADADPDAGDRPAADTAEASADSGTAENATITDEFPVETDASEEGDQSDGSEGDGSPRDTDPTVEADPTEEDPTSADDSPSDPSPSSEPNSTSESDSDPVTAADIDIEESIGPTDSSGGGKTDLGLDEVVLDDDDSQGLFDDLLSGEPIFENKEVLRPSYTPHELPHRTEQINQMATILVSALRGETPSNILIYGKTGTGKTASAKFVSQELESTSKKYDVPCEVEYINCEVTDTQYRVLAQLANKFIEKNQNVIDAELAELNELHSEAADAAAPATSLADTEFETIDDVADRIEKLEDDREGMESVPMTGWPTDRVYSTFFDAVDYEERVVVIMLDEIDKLVEKSGDDTLYNLSRMNSELDNSRISIMGISNDLKFTDFLDPRVKSSLGEEEIVFPPYDANQLRDILQHRANVAFKQDALTDDVIPLCAAFAAQEHGDARRALDLLRTAGELAERGQADTVEEAHVRKAQDKIELDRVVEVVRTLPTQSKIVLFATILLEKNGVRNVNTGEVFNIYKRLCEEIDADVLTQRRVTDLISELDMLGIVNAVVVSKGRYGRTKEISLSVPIDETEAVLLSDSRLGDIENAQPFVQARFDN
ncbi:Cdc6/Cdc18 family protein [Halobellus clavatus]|jgi:cell division control protein 6|uniref:ORC1-type DNA replication protein n=1 Tax=Halobellus clavatus TaxID=660517 RepID=A0A1H3E4R3_9EURY|nr:ORC1-type DNA replication protein [Halobellus clavatus]SDX73671.1 cell division control protein 6 [Halobellus clavatus]